VPTRYVPRPQCQQLMNRKNFAETSGAIVDVCKPHGIWLDRDELGRIIQFVMKSRRASSMSLAVASWSEWLTI